MDEDNYVTWARDAEVLARIGRHLFDQSTRVTVRLPRDLADRALAAWQREHDERPLPPETPEQRAIRHKAATLGLIGLTIERDSTTENGDVVVAIDAWDIGEACNAADEAGLLSDAKPPRS
jgi:hypothetical protein